MQTDWLATPATVGSTSEFIPLPDEAQLRYFSQFYNSLQSTEFLQRLLADTPWQQDHLRIAGKHVAVPRLQAWYGDKQSHYGYSGLKLTPRAWTPLLLSVKADIEQRLALAFNSVLLNWYRDGNDSVAWHADDEVELGANPQIASLSFGLTRRFELKHKQRKELGKLTLELGDGSLLLMGNNLQQHWLHQIPKQPGLTGSRLNLTFRFIHAMA
jgi:alkylated DNA repair dioxygenase AlkB